ncbi:hypothetical protein OZ429_12585 [Xanthomonas fragariae]|nr:hypothetical protein [Xanthomonas fragariae]WAT13948.1 hypothetical protein OZ429_12585 [Xanthomonas fragariae]
MLGRQGFYRDALGMALAADLGAATAHSDTVLVHQDAADAGVGLAQPAALHPLQKSLRHPILISARQHVERRIFANQLRYAAEE